MLRDHKTTSMAVIIKEKLLTRNEDNKLKLFFCFYALRPLPQYKKLILQKYF